MRINYKNLLDFKPFEMQHYKPDKTDLKYYTKYLPRNKDNEIITEPNDIFNTKYLLINNPEISFDYIYSIREKESEKIKHEKNKIVQRLQKKIQKKFDKNLQINETDRRIDSKKPKFFNTGKRGLGKTDWR